MEADGGKTIYRKIFTPPPTQNSLTTDQISQTFGNVTGSDVDVNACQATRLSLALLHLVLLNSLPASLKVFSSEFIEYFQLHPELKQTMDAVIANPPYVSIGFQSKKTRERVSKFMAKDAGGRIDLYLAFLKIAVEMLKPDGFGMFVIPHSFLLSKNAAGVRELLHKNCWIRFLGDVSAIRIFQDSSIYVLLLIFQKKSTETPKAPPATILKCHDLVGKALSTVLEGRRAETNVYSIYDVDQGIFASPDWLILPPAESAINQKLKLLPVLGDFMEIRVGFNSGANSIFIVSAERLLQLDEAIFVPFLDDRRMNSYSVPHSTSQYFFYPFVDGKKIEAEKDLKKHFKKTWAYLSKNKSELEKRPAVQKKEIEWWQPERPRPPEHMIRPKIISPHLVVLPRFSLDIKGKYAISRSPILYPKQTGAETDLLKYFVGILNSTACYWYIAAHAHTYRGGYVHLEPKTLKSTPIPDPAKISPADMRSFLHLIEKRLSSSESMSFALEKQIDEMAFVFYNFSDHERRALGADK